MSRKNCLKSLKEPGIVTMESILEFIKMMIILFNIM